MIARRQAAHSLAKHFSAKQGGWIEGHRMGMSKVGHVQIGCNGICFQKLYNTFYIHNICTSSIHMCIYMYGEMRSGRVVVRRVTGAT